MADEGPCTLYVRHLPAQLTLPDREDLLRFFGARSVRCMSDNTDMKYSAFAVFPSPEMAAHALLELHQLEILGSRLCATFSSRSFLDPAPLKQAKPKKDKKKEDEDEPPLEPVVPPDIDDLAPMHKVNYPLNPKLMYSYPPPNVQILTNIANALASVPKFYVQVLHLMNKMNLPSPFGIVTQSPPVPSAPPPEPQALMPISSSESELESDKEEKAKSSKKAVKRPAPAPKKPVTIKRQKVQSVAVAPNAQTATAAQAKKPLKRSEVFERPPVEKQPKPQTKTTETVAVGTDGKDDKDIFTEDKDVRKFITLKELEKNRLSTRGMRRITVYKDYNPGKRSSRLLVTNLQKDIPEATITYVFGRYINWESESEKKAYSVVLDRESKSCTVSFPSEDIAELALQETNGYRLMGEFMVVKFGPQPEPESESESEPEPEPVKEVENPNIEAIVAENLNVIEKAFSADAGTSLDMFGGLTPPRVDGAKTPEKAGGSETPEKTAGSKTPEKADERAETPETGEGSQTPVKVETGSEPEPMEAAASSPKPPSEDSEKTIEERSESETSEAKRAQSESPTTEEKRESSISPTEAVSEEKEADFAVATTSTEMGTDPMEFEAKGSDSETEEEESEEEEEEEEDEEEEEELEDYEDDRYITTAELEKSRITGEKMAAFKVFKNYKPGDPTNRLYVKNLNPKEVKEFQLIWLFGRFLKNKYTDASYNLDIKLMKEGRMKGQAFVTFPTVDEAKRALAAVNGYVLHGKPMVIVYGKQS